MKPRIYNLDLLRFFAALFVLLFHYTFRGYTADHLSPVGFPLFAPVFKYGYLGVDLFFIISGFVILMSAENATVNQFFASRISRLYPAYWVAVTISSLAVILIHGHPFEVTWGQYFINLTMLNEFIGVESVDGAYWSLAIELKFYFLIAVVLVFSKISHIYPLLITWLAISIAVLFIPTQYAIVSSAIKTIFITNWSSYFIAGMLFYLIRRDSASPLPIALLIASLVLSIYNSSIRMDGYRTHFATAYSVWVLIALVICFYALVFLLTTEKLDFLSNKVFLQLGVLTYPLYLIHQLVGYILFYRFAQYNKYLVLILIIFIVLFISFLINRLVERKLGPFLKRKILETPFKQST